MDNAGGYEKAKDEFFKEARIFKLMNHPNLVQVSNYFVVVLISSASIKIIENKFHEPSYGCFSHHRYMLYAWKSLPSY